ncbi:MAG: hypothetical protein KGJ98_08055 [Chloroflexota bacterium]|nr:hypothetical protein [Chloroflexota bacterium]
MTALVGALAAATAVTAGVLAKVVPDVAPPAVSHPDRTALADAGWARPLREWEAVRAGLVVAAVVLAVAAGWPPALGSLAAVAPSIWIRARAAAARDRAHRAILPLVVATEAALRSGAALPDALRRALVSEPDALATRPLRSALDAFDLGASLASSLVAAADTSRDERVAAVFGTVALGVGERLPRERLADLLGAVASRLAFEDGLAREVAARAAGVRQQQRLIALLVPGIAAYLFVTMPVLAATLASDLGRFVLVPAAAALEVAGLVLSARVVRAAMR